MNLTTEQKLYLVKKGRRGQLTGFETGWLLFLNEMETHYGNGPILTPKQSSEIGDPFRPSYGRADSLDLDRFIDGAYHVQISLNELFAHLWLAQGTLNHFTSSILGAIYEREHKEPFPEDYLMRHKKDLLEDFDRYVKKSLEGALAFEKALGELSRALKQYVPGTQTLENQFTPTQERYNYFLSLVKGERGYRKTWDHIPYVDYTQLEPSSGIYEVLRKRFWYNNEQSLLDFDFDPKEMLE